jgi:hypothetical protein
MGHTAARRLSSSDVRPGRWVWAASVVVIAYSALLLVPKRSPGLAGTQLFFVYVLSLPVAVLVLLALGIWGGVGLLRSRAHQRPFRRSHGAYVFIGCVGLASFALAVGLLRALPSPLPTGSHRQSFDRAVWHDPRSAEYRDGDATPRQKMLADVVRNVLPGRTRVELEEILGPSLNTSYFKGKGRDLIYMLGPQRDSYITIDSEWLLIWLDKDGRFERYTIAND